jgi:hypothetical protein
VETSEFAHFGASIGSSDDGSGAVLDRNMQQQKSLGAADRGWKGGGSSGYGIFRGGDVLDWALGLNGPGEENDKQENKERTS